MVLRPCEAYNPAMYSTDDLLHLLVSDGADRLKLHVGTPPVLVLDREPNVVEGPPLTSDDLDRVLRDLTDTRQRRVLRETGSLQIVCRFRGTTDVVVECKSEGENVAIEIH
jgi:Tfp pilus assembly pilus retraction ATPase PilT